MPQRVSWWRWGADWQNTGHCQLPFESIARETGAKTMRRASFERYFGGRIRGIFLCAWIPLRSASQPTSHQRAPNPRDVVFGERWWIPTAAISVVLMCGVVSSVYMRLKQISNFYQHLQLQYLPKEIDLSQYFQHSSVSSMQHYAASSEPSFLSNSINSPRSTSCGRRPSPQRGLAIARLGGSWGSWGLCFTQWIGLRENLNRKP